MIMWCLFFIFINVQIVEPLKGLSQDMDTKISILESFAALTNSGAVLLIFPLFFLVLSADFPSKGIEKYFYTIRCSKTVWTLGQVVYAFKLAVFVVCVSLLLSAISSVGFSSFSLNYSDAVTKFVSVFPNRELEYVAQLIPENLYNQISLMRAVTESALLLILYFFMLAMVLFLFSTFEKKVLGIFADGMIILGGTVTCASKVSFMWAFPMAHTIPWLHYTKYSSNPVLPICYSYIYFVVIDVLLVIVSMIMVKFSNGHN